MALLRATVEPLHLALNKPFRIAHGTSTERTNALVRIGEGLGEAGLPPYLPTDYAAVESWVQALEPLDAAPQRLEHTLAGLPDGPPAARCALDVALHDHAARLLGVPLPTLFGVDPSMAPASFITISIPDEPEEIAGEVERLGPNTPIKLKVGTGDVEMDLAFIEAVCSTTEAPVCVDANGAWSIPDAVQLVPRCESMGVTVLEQPIAPDDPDDWHLLRRLLGPSPRPALIADESVFSDADVIGLAGAADGINIKLAKCGGLRPARRLVGLARALDLKVMVGCMVESSVAIAAAACIAPLADFTDLDGLLMLADEPFTGIRLEGGRIVYAQSEPGLGICER